MSAETPGLKAGQSRVSVEATELNKDETGWAEAGIFVERGGEEDPELVSQALLLNNGELRAVYDALSLHYRQGIWSFRTIGPPVSCRTCGGSGQLTVPDPGMESASEQPCPDPAHRREPEESPDADDHGNAPY